jgi:hypothetical protein
MQGSLGSLLGGHPLRTWLEQKLAGDVTAAVTAAGGDTTHVQNVVTEVLGQQTIWQWLLSVNWQGLIAMILQVLSLIPKA